MAHTRERELKILMARSLAAEGGGCVNPLRCGVGSAAAPLPSVGDAGTRKAFAGSY